jgi:hypothetical protein
MFGIFQNSWEFSHIKLPAFGFPDRASTFDQTMIVFSHLRKQTGPSQFRDIQAFNRRGSRRKEIEGGQWKRIGKHGLAFPELKALNH